jgi:hypothetical protein
MAALDGKPNPGFELRADGLALRLIAGEWWGRKNPKKV